MSTTEPVFVLVHSPLVGPLTWQPVGDELRRRGRHVVLPRLDNPDHVIGSYFHHHAERVRRSVEAENRTAPVVLVGHSGAGPILPAIGETLVNEVVGYVFVDSDLPSDRARRIDTAPPEFGEQLQRLSTGGRLPPWAEWWSDDVLTALLPDEDVREAFAEQLAPLPVSLFEERIRVPPEWPDAPCGFVRLSPIYDHALLGAQRLGWELITFDAAHLHMLVDPPTVADALVEMADRLVGADVPPREPASDPVNETRVQVARWVDLGRRVGFLALAVAVTLFATALYWDLPSILVQLVIASLVIACLTLLPALIGGYGLAAAQREDEERRHR